MALGIGQQFRQMVDRAKHYWSELTDEDGARRRHDQEEREEAVHQRYGGVRAQGERDMDSMLRDRQENSMDRGLSDAELANPTVRAARGDTSPSRMGSGSAGRPSEQLGSQDLQDQPRNQQMQGDAQRPGDAQRQRQYTQQGGSGIQKTLAEQLGSTTSQTGATGAGIGSEPDTVRSSQTRRPDQQNH